MLIKRLILGSCGCFRQAKTFSAGYGLGCRPDIGCVAGFPVRRQSRDGGRPETGTLREQLHCVHTELLFARPLPFSLAARYVRAGQQHHGGRRRPERFRFTYKLTKIQTRISDSGSERVLREGKSEGRNGNFCSIHLQWSGFPIYPR